MELCFVNGKEVNIVTAFFQQPNNLSGQFIASLSVVAGKWPAPLRRKKFFSMELEFLRHLAAEVFSDGFVKSLMCCIPSFVADTDASENENRLLCTSQVRPSAAGFIKIIEVHLLSPRSPLLTSDLACQE